MRRNSTKNKSNAIKAIYLIFLIANFSTLSGNCDAQDRSVRVAIAKCVANTSDKVQITESTELPTDHVVMTIARETKRIGLYHRGLERFILWNGHLTKGEGNKSLPKAVMAPHGLVMKKFDNGRLGVQYEFNAPDPGVYIVNTTWTLRASTMNAPKLVERKGNPVLLFVEPAVDYDNQVQSNGNTDGGLSLQDFLERTFDDNPDEVGVLMPKFN